MIFLPAHRDAINSALRSARAAPSKNADAKLPIRKMKGILRALDLDRDWLELSNPADPAKPHIRIVKVSDALDDVVGPMVNRLVVVEATQLKSGQLEYLDIQLEE